MAFQWNELQAHKCSTGFIMLWEVVYADGKVHDFEVSLLRRLGGLLYVSDRDRALARKRVLQRLGQS